MILTALKMFRAQENSQSSNNNQINELILKFEGDLAQLARILKPKLDEESKRKGTKLIIGGAT